MQTQNIYSSVLENIRIDGAREKTRFAFFGTPHLAAVFLDELEKAGFTPSLVVTTPDRKQGRGLELTPPPVKVWAQKRNIEVLQPEHLDSEFSSQLEARSSKLDVFVVIYYGKILPQEILSIPKRGTLNIHFSLLPRWRGTSPVRAAILNDDREIGTSIILLDEKIDHGPVVAQKKIPLPLEGWPPRASEMETTCTFESAKLLAQIFPEWTAGHIEAREQNHDLATQCPTLTKEDGLISLKDDPYKNLLKIRAFDTTIGTHAFFARDDKNIRVNILDAYIANGALQIETIKPEGKREMKYEEFLRSGARPI